MPFDKTLINDPALSLQRALNSGDEKFIHEAIAQLTKIVSAKTKPLTMERGDQIRFSEEEDEFLTTGQTWLDTYLCGGLRKQELVLIGGAPYQGKTHLLTYLSACYLKAHPFRVAHFNGEDVKRDIIRCYHSALSQAEQLERLFFADVVDSAFTPAVVDAALTAQPCDVVVVDNLDIMSGAGSDSDWLEISEIAKDLRMVAKRHNVLMLVGTQLNFQNDQQYGGSGMQRFFRAKVGKASHADVILLIAESYNGNLKMELAKRRGKRVPEKFMTWKTDFDRMEIKP